MQGTRGARIRLAVACAALGAALAVATAFAATGDLTPKGCLDDQPPGGPDNCTDSSLGLNGATGVVVSPDGKSVYASSDLDEAVVRFDRSKNGTLTPRGCVETTGQNECDQEADGLGSPRPMAMSPDGKSLYVGALGDDTIVHFKRKKSGAITPKGCIEDTGGTACADETDGLSNPFSL